MSRISPSSIFKIWNIYLKRTGGKGKKERENVYEDSVDGCVGRFFFSKSRGRGHKLGLTPEFVPTGERDAVPVVPVCLQAQHLSLSTGTASLSKTHVLSFHLSIVVCV
jgi:hypothetical protein